MADYDATASRFVAKRLGKTTKPYLRGNPGPGYRDGRMYVERDVLYSYGSHFILAQYNTPTKRSPLGLFLVNGDTWGPTTGKQQRSTREAVARSGAPWVIIPNRAINAAGISPETVELIDRSDDRTIRWVETSRDVPSDSEWKRVRVTDAYAVNGDLDADGNGWVDHYRHGYSLPHTVWRGMQFNLLNMLHNKDAVRRGKHYGVITPEKWHWSELGLYSKRSKWDAKSDWDYDAESKTYSRNRSRHLLGESLITAEIVYIARVKCAECNGTGLAPEHWQDEWEVRRYKSAHRDWVEFHEEWDQKKRNHNMDAIFDGVAISRWNAEPTAEPTAPMFNSFCRTCGGRNKNTVPVTRTRRAYFLSGFDANETRPSYFFCELPPKAKPTTVAEAYEALKPEAVKLAEQMGREVVRQGDIFAIPTQYTKRDLVKMGATFARNAYVLRTNHRVTEVALLPDGTTLGRGTLKHAPEGRQPDHKRQSIGKAYAILTKNTVPTTK